MELNTKNNHPATVIIPNWNGKHFLKACLASIFNQGYKDFEVIVVDCASSDGSAAFVRENYPQARLIELKEDKGPPHGINLAVRQAKGDYVLILNNDVILPPDLLGKVVSELKKDVNCVINPVELNFNGEFVGAGCLDSGLGRIFCKFLKSNGSIPFFPSTACCLTTRSLLLQNPLNENLFMYEDTEWGWRLILKAIKLKVLTNTFFLHHGAGTGSAYSPKQSFFLGRLVIGNYFICFKTSTFIILFPFIFLNMARQVLGLAKRKRWNSIKFYCKGLASFLKNLRTFNKDRVRVLRNRFINDWEVIKIMVGAFEFNRKIKENWNRNLFSRGKKFAGKIGPRS